jgi:hypothetical protein
MFPVEHAAAVEKRPLPGRSFDVGHCGELQVRHDVPRGTRFSVSLRAFTTDTQFAVPPSLRRGHIWHVACVVPRGTEE